MIEKENNSVTPPIMTDGNAALAPRSGPSEDFWVAKLRARPDYLACKSLQDLYAEAFVSPPPVIENLLMRGVYLLAGPPKIGKSFLVAQLAYHVSLGLPIWGYPVRQGTVLYLALEDDEERLQKRMFLMYDPHDTDELYFAQTAGRLEDSLIPQLTSFLKNHPRTNLIIVDTFQKIRGTDGAKYSYADDYTAIVQLKNFADTNGICVVAVHHTRKQSADDPFDLISGTTGLLGAADGAMILRKKDRTSSEATLEVTGRDQPDQKLYLQKDPASQIWQLSQAEVEIRSAPPDPVLDAVAKFVGDNGGRWTGTATELVQSTAVDLAPNAMGKHLNVRASELYNIHHIRYTTRARHNGREISLVSEPVETEETAEQSGPEP